MASSELGICRCIQVLYPLNCPNLIRSTRSVHLTSRWDAGYEAVNLADIPHRRLTKPTKVLEQWFDGRERKGRGRCAPRGLALPPALSRNAFAWLARSIWFSTSDVQPCND